MSRYLVDRIARIPNVHVMTSTEVRELHGEAALEAVTVTDNRTGTRCTIDARGAALADDTQAWLPLLFGGIGVALARTFALIDAELKAVHTRDWERTFELFRLLI
jgi:hypothetical protein